MKCFFDACQREISADPVEWRRVDGVEKVFGRDCPDGTLAEGRDGGWPLIRTAHHRCYFAGVKRQRLADARPADPAGQRRQPVGAPADVEECPGGLGRADRGNGTAPG